ncbi:RHS repeat-associated core domain-containing protein [Nonomuraea sp. NPDC050556]|uniref:RHS repeat-associated core domain-containing protein n=1 Tax=Nonomuraea sp. NPDC050556 TaxID=3364369 RepID=UPI00378A5734
MIRKVLLCAVSVVALAGSQPVFAAASAWRPPVARDVMSVAVKDAPRGQRLKLQEPPRVRAAEAVAWPSSSDTVLDLSSKAVRAASTPVSARTATPGLARARLTIHDRASAERARVSGVLMSLSRADGVRSAGTLGLSVDYAPFAAAYGGDWASRLRLVRLPACALTTPEAPGCDTSTPVPSTNSPATRTLSGEVGLAADGSATVLAATAGPSGDNGDYTATSLSPASTWQVSQQTGAFSWSYPLRLPASVGGPVPSLKLGYSSQAVDGRTGGTNTQGSWIGDGWDMWPGFIERTYKPCAQDTEGSPNNKNLPSGDQCWWKQNATLSLNGRATELIDVGGGRWKGVSDDGSKTELLGDHWKVTTIDGTQYFFGKDGSSAWSTQVYGNHPGEPGYVAGNFAASRQTQVWRWNLSQVLDRHGNTMNLFYEKETGAYGREGDPGKRTTYDRGGWLSRIEYGSRTDQAQPSARVLFDVADRCVTGTACYDAAGKPVAAAFPDTPFDQFCPEGTRCTDQLAPTYWTQKRLAQISAQVWEGSQYRTVESWKLRHSYLNAGSAQNEGVPMWLDGITRTGSGVAGGAPVSDPEVVFSPGAYPYPNRVDGPSDNRTALNRFRIKSITTESGAQLGISYLLGDCARDALPQPHDNRKRCMPQWYAPSGEPTLDWFHKYVVSRVDVYDNTGGFLHEQTNYDYLDEPAWRYSDSELVEEKKRTWSSWRGYGRVRVRTGLESGVQSAVEYRYFRGMDGDKQLSGVRDVWIKDSLDGSGDPHTKGMEDHDALAGTMREQITYDGAQWVAGTLNEPALRETGANAQGGPLKSYMINVATAFNRVRLTATGGARWTRTDTKVNADNLPIEVKDLGDESTGADDLRKTTTYLVNEEAWIRDKVGQSETFGASGAVVARSRNYFDDPGKPYGTAPTRGLVVRTEDWQGGATPWMTLSTATYDANGRVLTSADALGRTTTTTYTPAKAGPVTAVRTVDPAGHATTTTMETAWQQPRLVVDANDGRTELAYDGLGRLTSVWLPGRERATQGADLRFSYLVRNNAPTAITTRKLLPDGTNKYLTSIALFDGLLRERQTQTQAIGGGRLITDSVRDSRGLVSWTSAPYYHDGSAPATALVVPATTVPSVTDNVHDGAGRLVETGLRGKWKTTTVYGGDRITVIPPAGGIRTETISDARGRTVELRQYKATGYEKTTYTYTERGDQETVTDQAGNVWRYAYDQRGRKTRTEDPDRGASTSVYDDAGQLVSVTDARQVTLAYTYDALGRKTSLREGSPTGTVRAEWSYDTAPGGVGKLAGTVRHDGTNRYTTEVTGYEASGRPLGSRITIPPAEGKLAGTYTFATTYKQDGQIATTTGPTGETLEYGYNAVGSTSYLRSATQTYVNDTVYNQRGQIIQRVLGQDDRRVWQTTTIDEQTGRTSAYSVVPELRNEVFDLAYGYDDTGNLTRIADTPNGGQPADYQCYSYDHARRLTEAWTPATGDCAPASRTVAGLGGPAAYWHSYAYTVNGSRDTETRHGAATVVRDFVQPTQGGPRPHTTVQAGTDTFTYDAAGNMDKRVVNGVTTAMTWDQEGRLATSGQTTHLYDADGRRLLRRDPGGTTLYLPGDLELRTTGTAVAATQYYDHTGTTVAVRTAGVLHWTAQDHHDTGEATIRASDLTVTRRRTLPFGGPRGTVSGSWPGDKGFVGGTSDPSGLTRVGARDYDPALGSFVSADPVVDTDDPQQIHGYSYSNGNPTSMSDPTGLLLMADGGGGGGTPPCTGTPDRCADQRGLNTVSKTYTGEDFEKCDTSCQSQAAQAAQRWRAAVEKQKYMQHRLEICMSFTFGDADFCNKRYPQDTHTYSIGVVTELGPTSVELTDAVIGMPQAYNMPGQPQASNVYLAYTQAQMQQLVEERGWQTGLMVGPPQFMYTEGEGGSRSVITGTQSGAETRIQLPVDGISGVVYAYPIVDVSYGRTVYFVDGVYAGAEYRNNTRIVTVGARSVPTYDDVPR